MAMTLRILFLTHKFYPDVGGIEVNSEILANAFHRAGHTLRLLTWSRGDDKKKFPFEVTRDPSVLEMLQAHRWADVVFENNPCMRLAWPSVFFLKPSIVALRTWVSRSDGRIQWQDKIKLARLKHARSVIAVSDSVRRKCWPKAVVIANPYRADTFVSLENSKRDYDFVFLGRLVSDKGADLAIKALQKVMYAKDAGQKNEGAGYSLTIIGDGPDRKKLEDLANALGPRVRIRFTGILRGKVLVSWLNRHKYLLVPSVWEEPFGNVVLEGMACGCIPIVSDGGGLPDAVGDAGLIFKRGDVDSLTGCIRKVIDDADLRARLRKAAKSHLAAHHPDIIAEKYLDVIRSVKSTS